MASDLSDRNRSHANKNGGRVLVGESCGDRVGDEVEDGAVLLATGFDDGQHCLDEPAASGALGPNESLRQMTAWRKARSAALFVGSTSA